MKPLKPASSFSRRHLAAICAMVVIIFLAYANVFHVPFVFDDLPNISQNRSVHFRDFSLDEIRELIRYNSKESIRLFAYATFAANYYFGGLDVFGYHLVNLLIHFASGLALYWFLLLTFNLSSLKERYGSKSFSIALFSCLLFLSHPVQTQSVTYIVQRMTSMGAMFYLVGLALFIKGRISSGGRRYLCWAGMTVAYFLGLFTKENVAILPFFIALYEFYFFQNVGFNPQGKKALTYVFGTVALIGLLGFLILGDRYYEVIVEGYKIRDFTLTERVLTQFRVVLHYVTLLLYPAPSRLNLDYDFPLSRDIFDPWTTLLSILIIAGLMGYSVWVARRRPLFSYFVLWYFGNLAIESSIFPLEMVFEHRLYLPSVGPIVLFVVSLLRGWECLRTGKGRKWGQRPLWTFFCCLTLLFAAGSYQRNLVWRDQITLWQDVLAKSPNKSRPHNYLGAAYNERGMVDRAIEHFLTAVRQDPRSASARNNLGLAYDKKGLVDQAIEQFRIAISLKPLSGTYVNLGVAYSNKGLIDEAIKQYRVAIELNPDNADAYVNLGIAYGEKGFMDQAIEYLKTAVRLNPEDPHAHHNLANAYRIKGFLAKAQEHLQKAKKLQRK